LLEQAIRLASEALELNSQNSHACMALALAYNYKCLYRWGDNPDAALTNAERIIDRLMQLDPVNARSYMVRAWVRHFRRDSDAAYADYKRAFELNPNDAMNLYSMAWEESFMGLSSAAKEHAHLAFRLSPRDTDVWLGEGYLALTQATFAEQSFDQALHWGKLAIQFGPNVPIRRLLMISAEGHLGKMEYARQHFDALSQFAPRFISDVLSGAIEIYQRPEHRNLVVEGLRRTALMQ
jgi:tetratricopeptide (TPR) repeat protein